MAQARLALNSKNLERVRWERPFIEETGREIQTGERVVRNLNEGSMRRTTPETVVGREWRVGGERGRRVETALGNTGDRTTRDQTETQGTRNGGSRCH